MRNKLCGLFVLGLAFSAIWSSTAAAGNWWGGAWFPPVRYYQSDRQIPYFAEHPPVYYSYPVPRTYGYSPYAYPPCVMTPTLDLPPAPLEIPNPYVPQSQKQRTSPSSPREKTASTEVSAGPLWVINPFVQDIERVAERADR